MIGIGNQKVLKGIIDRQEGEFPISLRFNLPDFVSRTLKVFEDSCGIRDEILSEGRQA